jgi:hypothetical protein
MREVLSVFTFGIGALCFVVFVTVFQSGDVRCWHFSDVAGPTDDVCCRG